MTTGAVAVAMVVVAIAAILPFLAPRRVFVFFVQVMAAFILVATASSTFATHDSVVLPFTGSTCSPVVVVTVIIAYQISLMNESSRTYCISAIMFNQPSWTMETDLSASRSGNAPRRQPWTVPAHAHALLQVRSKTGCGHVALAVRTDALSRFFAIDRCRW